jgi:hypothetical protein
MVRRILSPVAALPILLVAGSADAHPDLYYGEDEVAGLKARAVDDTPTPQGWSYAEAFTGFVAAADGAIATPYSYTVEIPDIDGSGSATWTYALSAQMPGPHPNNPSYPPWTKISRDLENRLVALAFVWAMTGDDAYLRNAEGTGAVDIALLVSQWSQWTDPYYSCGSACLDTAHLTFGMAALYDFAYDALDEDERAAIRTAIASKGVAPLVQEVQAMPKEAWFNGFALRVAGLAVGASAIAPEIGAPADAWLAAAHEASMDFVAGQGTDGGTYEGQLYGAYAVDRLVQGLAALERRGYTESFDDPWLRDLPRFAAGFLSDDLRSAAPIGDSSLAVYWVSTMFALAAHGDGRAQWYLHTTEREKPTGILPFVWARPDLAPDPLPGTGSAVFHDVGWAALRAGFDGTPVVAVKSGPPTVHVGHNHFDAASFTLSAHGQWIASDPGYRDYFNPSRSTYTVRTVGHNTIMVDKTVAADGSSVGGGQDSLVGASLEYFFEGRGYAKVVAKAAAAYPDTLLSRFDRRIFYAKPDVVFVFDDLAAPQARAYSWLLHAAPGALSATADGGPAELAITRGVARLQTFAVSSAPWADGYPRTTTHPGAEALGSYGEWRTAPASAATIAAVLVPGRHAVEDVPNAGFEDGLEGWQPRYDDATHAVDGTVASEGTASGRITFASDDSGYFYASPITVTPGGTFDASVFVRAEAEGEIGVQAYWMKNGSYIADPAGPRTAVDAADLAEFTQVSVSGDVPDGVDEMRVALQFGGNGSVWFDDASTSASDVVPADPSAHAVALGDPALGIAVEGAFGVHAGASTIGTGLSGLVELHAADASIAAVPSLSSDAQIFTVGLDPGGETTHVFVQGGSVVRLGDTDVLTLSAAGSIDIGVQHDELGCARVDATQYPSGEAPPYALRAAPGEVWMDGERVAFVQAGESVIFPMGDDVGPGCPDPEPPGDTDGSDGSGGSVDDTGGRDATGDGTSAPATDGDEGTTDASASSDDGGCGCRSRTPRHGPPASALALLMGMAAVRRRR